MYVLTEEDSAVLLRIEPAHAITALPGKHRAGRPVGGGHACRRCRKRNGPDEQRALVEKYAPDGNPGNALRTLIRVPPLADGIFPVVDYLAHDSTLSRRHRAMLILRTAWLTQNATLWATRASRASEAGLTDEEVRRVAEGPNDGWSEFEGFLVGLADELFRNSSVTDQTWDTLSEHLRPCTT